MSSDNATAVAQESAVAAVGVAALEDLERQYVAVMAEKDLLNQKWQESVAALAKSETALTDSRAAAGTRAATQHAVDTAQQQVTALTLQNQSLQERADRMQAESDQLREEISRLTLSHTEMAKAVQTAEIQAKLSESDAIPLHHAKQRLQTELDSVQAHAAWLEQELQAKQQDYQHLQQDSRDRTIQLQAKLTAQHKLERALSDKLQVLTRDNLDLKLTVQTQQETAAIEMQEKKEQIFFWQQRYRFAVHEIE